VLGSELIDQLAEYDAPNYKIEHGKFAGSVTLASLEPRRRANALAALPDRGQ
jgi:hypothetical protein